MVVIRLARAGAKKRPFYHVVAIDRRRARNSGNYIERLGYFNPNAKGAEARLHLEHDRIAHWEGLGAQLSDTVHNLRRESSRVAAGLPSYSQKRKTKRAAQKANEAKAKAANVAAENAEGSAEA